MPIRHFVELSITEFAFVVYAQDDNPTTSSYPVTQGLNSEQEAIQQKEIFDREMISGLVPSYKKLPPWIIENLAGERKFGPYFHRSENGNLYLIGSQPDIQKLNFVEST